MDCELPEHPPAPCVLAEMCTSRAWDDDINDRDRQLLEWAGDMLAALLVLNARYTARAEVLEANLAARGEML